MPGSKTSNELANFMEDEDSSSSEEEVYNKPKKSNGSFFKEHNKSKFCLKKRERSLKKNKKDMNDDDENYKHGDFLFDDKEDKITSSDEIQGKKKPKNKKNFDTLKIENDNFISKEDVNVIQIITLKRINNVLYAYVMYTVKGSRNSSINKGYIATSKFINSEPELLLSFYESKIDNLLKEDEEAKNCETKLKVEEKSDSSFSDDSVNYNDNKLDKQHSLSISDSSSQISNKTFDYPKNKGIPILSVNVNIKPGVNKRIFVFEGDNPSSLTDKIIKKYHVDPQKREKIEKTIHSQMRGFIKSME